MTDRVKESLFSILQTRLKEARVADLFCGTGSLGVEAYRRLQTMDRREYGDMAITFLNLEANDTP